MRWLLAVLLAGHGLIHLMGVAKAFGLAELPQLVEPISKGWGVVWLVAALALVATAVAVAAGSAWWWIPGVAGVVLSQAAIISSWHDAKFGTAANLVLLLAVVYGVASEGPTSLRAEYRRAVEARLAAHTGGAPPVLGESDLEALPPPVRRYVRMTGAVGQPRIWHVHATWRGRIRSGPDAPWMSFTAEQHNVLDGADGPARLFFMDATRAGLPVDVFHAFRDGAATMRVRVASLVPLVSASGPELTTAETVTLLNDLCLLAPGALVDPALSWEPIDDRSARVMYRLGEDVVGATLFFNADDELVDFVSDDRLAESDGGRQWTRQRWSTPVDGYRTFGPWRLMARGEGRWHPDSGAFAYIELELTDVQVNGARRPD